MPTLPVQPPAAYLPVNAQSDDTPAAASSHLRQSQALPPSASACLKTDAPDNGEHTKDDHSPVHVYKTKDHGVCQSQSPTQLPGLSVTIPFLQSSSSADNTPIALATTSPLPSSPHVTDALKKHPNNTPDSASANKSHPCSRTSSDTEPTETVLPNDNVFRFLPTNANFTPRRQRRRTRSKAARSISFSDVQDTDQPNDTKLSLAPQLN